jgi:hypothetical protein
LRPFAKGQCFFRERFSKRLEHEIPAKDKRWGSRKIRESNVVICEEWPFADKGILINQPPYISGI